MPALLKTTQIQEPSSASINLTLDTSGNGTFAGTSVMSSPYTMRNKIINGAMVIDQRNAGASVTPAGADYTLDRWRYTASQSSKVSVQQSSTAPAGFTNSLLITSLSSYSLAAGDYFSIQQRIEGYNFADLSFGSANAKTITISFWVRSSLTGTFGGSINNSNYTRSYPFSYTISSANTFEQKTITITGDTTGTWVTNDGIGAIVGFALGVGTTYSGTAGTWVATDVESVTGATSVVGTNGATFYITGVQLECGTVATPFEYRNYQQELAMCQRYYEKSHLPSVVPGTDNLNVAQTGAYSAYLDGGFTFNWRVDKRVQPTVTVQAPLNTPSANKIRQASTGTTLSLSGLTVWGNVANGAATGATTAYYQIGWTASAEL